MGSAQMTLGIALSPAKVNLRTSTAEPSASPTYVRPTGFSGLPPSGPATPVTDTARAAANLACALPAIAFATWALTAPCASSAAWVTSSKLVLASFE